MWPARSARIALASTSPRQLMNMGQRFPSRRSVASCGSNALVGRSRGCSARRAAFSCLISSDPQTRRNNDNRCPLRRNQPTWLPLHGAAVLQTLSHKLGRACTGFAARPSLFSDRGNETAFCRVPDIHGTSHPSPRVSPTTQGAVSSYPFSSLPIPSVPSGHHNGGRHVSQNAEISCRRAQGWMGCGTVRPASRRSSFRPMARRQRLRQPPKRCTKCQINGAIEQVRRQCISG